MHLPRKTYRLFSNVAQFCVTHQLIEPGRPIVAGISGGVDSVMLLAFLHWYAEQVNFPFVVCHVNHMIRGEEADRDEALVRAYCHERAIPFESVKAPVTDMAREIGRGIEETGRIVRRAAFLNIGRRYFEKNTLLTSDSVKSEEFPSLKISEDDVHRAAKEGTITDMTTTFDVALGHHMNDRAESILMHIGRGSGIAGLVGIRPRDGRFVRPFLNVRLEELVDSAQELDVVWREDATNESSDYLRNRIRHFLMPIWHDVLGYDPVPRLVSLGDLAAEDEKTLTQFANNALIDARLSDQSLSISAVCALPKGLALRVIRLFFEEETKLVDDEDLAHEEDDYEFFMSSIPMKDNKTFSANHAVSLLDLIYRVDTGEMIEGALNLPGNVTAYAKNGRFFLVREKKNVT
jgi:tRNA(Ile)-lysidine synthase TilS/MesJ